MLEGPERGLMEPYVTELRDGRLRMWMRTQMDCQYESLSSDGGRTWSPAAPGPLRSPESPVAVGRHPGSGLLVAVWNDNRKGRHTADRTPIVAAASADDGDSWFGRQRLDPADSDAVEGHSFSYPGVHFPDDGDTGLISYYERDDGPISLILRRFRLRVDAG